jgi:molybdopterin-binding protein
MKLNARKQIKGKILEVNKGATTSHVRVSLRANYRVNYQLA